MIKEKDLQTDEKPDCKSFMVSGPSSSLRSMIAEYVSGNVF